MRCISRGRAALRLRSEWAATCTWSEQSAKRKKGREGVKVMGGERRTHEEPTSSQREPKLPKNPSNALHPSHRIIRVRTPRRSFSVKGIFVRLRTSEGESMGERCCVGPLVGGQGRPTGAKGKTLARVSACRRCRQRRCKALELGGFRIDRRYTLP